MEQAEDKTATARTRTTKEDAILIKEGNQIETKQREGEERESVEQNYIRYGSRLQIRMCFIFIISSSFQVRQDIILCDI